MNGNIPKKQMIDFELGYTPSNLKNLRKIFNLTQNDIANLTESKIRVVQRWEADFSVKNRSDMPLSKWINLLDKLRVKGCNPLG